MSRRRSVLVGLVAGPWLWLLCRGLVPAADYVDLAAPWIVVEGGAVALLSAFLRFRRVALVLGSTATVFALVCALPRLPTTPSRVDQRAVRVLTQNMTGGSGEVDVLVAAIDEQRPDVVVVTESTGQVRQALAARFPHSSGVTQGSRGVQPYNTPNLDVFSRFALDAVGPDWLPGVRVVVTTPNGPLVLYGVHLPKVRVATTHEYSLPVPVRGRLMDDLVAAISAEDLPTMLVGDLNVWDRSGEYRRLAGVLRDAMRVRVPPSTTRRGALRWLFIRGDQVLAPRSWCAARPEWFTVTGADHRGIAVTVGPCAP